MAIHRSVSYARYNDTTERDSSDIFQAIEVGYPCRPYIQGVVTLYTSRCINKCPTSNCPTQIQSTSPIPNQTRLKRLVTRIIGQIKTTFLPQHPPHSTHRTQSQTFSAHGQGPLQMRKFSQIQLTNSST